MPAVGFAARRIGELEWDLVGDGPLRSRLESLARLHRVPVTFHGEQDRSRVRDLLERSQVLLAPSVTAANGDEEGIPVVIMEAMAHGLLVVSTRHSGIPELVSHGESGLLVAEHDSEALGNCLVMLHERPDMWMGMIEKARQRVEEAFDVHKLDDELHDELSRLALESR